MTVIADDESEIRESKVEVVTPESEENDIILKFASNFLLGWNLQDEKHVVLHFIQLEYYNVTRALLLLPWPYTFHNDKENLIANININNV
jgi:hypothetical protein